MLYAFLKLIFKITLQVFFRQFKVVNRHLIPKKGPLIVVSNHPSTFMDPIIAATLLKQQVHFIAKGTLFNTGLKNWILSNLMNAIPVYRRQDNVENPNKLQQNDAIFERCFEFLGEKGTLIIFPEGTSINERRLREIKTGTARIALGAEARNNFELGVSILTIGINYSDASTFRSDVWVNIDEPIQVSDFKEAYQEDEFEAVRALTEVIRQRLEQNLIITDDDTEDELVQQIEAIYKNQLIADLDLDPKEHAFTLTRGIVDAVNHFEEMDAPRVEALQDSVGKYMTQLNELQLEDRFLAQDKKRKRNIFRDSLWMLVTLILGFPVHLYGFVNNYIPYILPSKIAALLTKDEEYVGPIKMTSGIFTFSFFYALQVYLFHQYLAPNEWWTVAYAMSLPLSGFFAISYWQHSGKFLKHWRLISLFYQKPAEMGRLLQQRAEIIEVLEQAKEEYFSNQ
ncbi:MAG: lysophospholipid acyltransferase family protein [Chitinophagales bacterium]